MSRTEVIEFISPLILFWISDTISQEMVLLSATNVSECMGLGPKQTLKNSVQSSRRSSLVVISVSLFLQIFLGTLCSATSVILFHPTLFSDFHHVPFVLKLKCTFYHMHMWFRLLSVALVSEHCLVLSSLLQI